MELESCWCSMVAAAALHTGACRAAPAFLQHKHNDDSGNSEYINDDSSDNSSGNHNQNNKMISNHSNDDNRNMTTKVTKTKQLVKGWPTGIM